MRYRQTFSDNSSEMLSRRPRSRSRGARACRPQVLIALAAGAVTFGTGTVAVAGARLTQRIGQFSAKAIELLRKLYEQLRAFRNRKAGSRAEATPTEHRSAPRLEGHLALSDPRLQPSTTSPHPGLHNREWSKEGIQSKNFKPRRAVNMDALSGADQAAARQLKVNGWHKVRIKEVLESGADFRMKKLQPGDRLYGFTSAGFAKDIETSPYWLDEVGFEAVAAKYYRNGAWDREGVKNHVALPCYNRANAIDVAEITEPQTVVESTIARATELISYRDTKNSTGLVPKLMSGGGAQIAPDPRKIKSVISQ